jgi:hypothetical protein
LPRRWLRRNAMLECHWNRRLYGSVHKVGTWDCVDESAPRHPLTECPGLRVAASFSRHLTGDQALANVDLRGVDRVLLHNFVSVEKNHKRFLVAFSAAVDQIHIGNKVCGFRLQS